MTSPATAAKTAVVILSDPKAGGEEALGRCFNGLAAAFDARAHEDEVTVLFQGAGTRWPAELDKQDHPGHALYAAVKDSVAGVSCGCAEVFGSTEGAEQAGMDLVKGNPAPGTGGLPSLRRLATEGFRVLTF